MRTKPLLSALLTVTLAGGTALATAPAQAADARAKAGTTSLAKVLAADGNKYDRNWDDFDIVEKAVRAVLKAEPDSAVGVLADGDTGRPLFGAGAMLNVIEFEPGATVPLHSHVHEQLGLVLHGMQALVVDGVAHELGPMEGYVLPGGVQHSAYCGPEGALVLDVFQPVREDYRDAWERTA